MKKVLLAVFCLAGLNACESSNESLDLSYIYDSILFDKLKNYDQTLIEKRSKLGFVNAPAVDNCDNYIKAKRVSSIEQSINNQLVSSEYLVCDVLSILGMQPIKLITNVDDFGLVLAERLDLRTFTSSIRPMLTDESYTLRNLSGKDLITDALSVTRDTKGWFYKLKVVASIDINSNGIDDWIVYHSDESKSGNYRGYQTIIVMDVGVVGKNILSAAKSN